jgi:predicted aspartyl protease
MRRAVALALSLTLLAVAVPRAARAEIYRYTDERGQNYYVDGLQSVPERYRAGATPLGLRNAPPAPPPAPGAAVPAKAAGTATIKYPPGERIWVDVKINGSGVAKLLLDTGADRTMISPRTLEAAGVSTRRPIATGQAVGVTGSDRINWIMVESLEVGEARVGRMPVASYEMASAGDGDGLLGRDFLDQFKMTIDSAKGEVHLAPK